jgi:hypothetical protein
MIHPEKELWQAVIHLALLDAIPFKPRKRKRKTNEEWMADSWIRNGSRDFRNVCYLAGVDPDCLRDAYVAGRICPAALRSGRSAMTCKAYPRTPRDDHMRMAAE